MIATPASDRVFRLAEGPVWDDRTQRLLWVDILAGDVLIGTLRDDDTIGVDETLHFDVMVGAVAISEPGDLLVAALDRLVRVAPDRSRHAGPPLFSDPVRRFNDGKPDPAGRYLIGTMSMGVSSTTEQLLRVDGEQVQVIDDDLTLSNGLAWTADGTRMYNVDTMTGVIRVRHDDRETGASGEWSVFATTSGGNADGICIDAEDHLWVAVWGAGAVLRFSPDGEIVNRIEVAAPCTSSVAFAGPDLDVLVITTASDDHSHPDVSGYPDSGRLFTVRPGVRGVPSDRVSASVLNGHIPIARPE
jgi:sugar lactone lactonase YvrE